MDEVHLQQISAQVYARVGVATASPQNNSFGANASAVIGRDAASLALAWFADLSMSTGASR
jgi:hypothetical protein